MAKTSRYVGVSWNSNMSKWAAQVRMDDKLHHLGFLTDEAEANALVIRFKIAHRMLKPDGTRPTILEAFSYEDGALISLYKTSKYSVGDVVGHARPGDGYIRIKFAQKVYFVHRLIWEMHNGAIPENHEIDHINGETGDNRIENLRLVTRKENAKNLSLASRNRTGVSGVAFMNNHYRVTIGGEYLGFYETFEEAVHIRREAEKRLGYHENHGRTK
jgi:hypothetical protein